MAKENTEIAKPFLCTLLRATVAHIGREYFESLVATLAKQTGAISAEIIVEQPGTEPALVARYGDAIEIPTKISDCGFVQQFVDTNNASLGKLTLIFNCSYVPMMELEQAIDFISPRIIAEFGRADLEQRLTMAHRREVMHSRVLGMAATHQPLNSVLEAVVFGVEAEHPELICSILLVNKDRKRLVTGAAPSLPADFNKAICGTPIRMGMGSCGTAAFTGERVIADDLQVHPYWQGVREITAKHQLMSCWSQPIKASNGLVLGTFAIYQRIPDAPCDSEIELIESTAQLLGLVLDHYQTLEQLEVRTREYKMFLQMASDGIVVIDMLGTIVEASDGFLRMVEADNRDLVVGTSIWEWDALNDEVACKKRLDMLSEIPVIYHTINRTVGGRLWNAEVSSAAFVVDKKQLIWASARDVTERKRLESELHRRATTDELTGIANRGCFMDNLSAERSRSARRQRQLAVIMMDIDHFKQINDKYGHAIGDKTLRAITALCSEVLREEDAFGRLGGEEFAVMLPETEAIHALEVAERMRSLIAGLAIEVNSESGAAILKTTCSFGVAMLNGADTNHEQLLARADKALYEAKQTGRNRVCFAKT